MKRSRGDAAKPTIALQFALSIHLKSGDILYLDGVSKEEKEKYLEYCKTGKEKIILENKNKLWRINPDDIQKIYYKSYFKDSVETWSITRTLLSESAISSNVYYTIIKLMIILSILLFMQVGFKIIASGKIFEILTNIDKLRLYIDKAFSNVSLLFMLTLFTMFVINIIDLFLPTSKKYRIADEDRDYFSNLKYRHILITIFYAISYFVVISGLEILIKILF